MSQIIRYPLSICLEFLLLLLALSSVSCSKWKKDKEDYSNPVEMTLAVYAGEDLPGKFAPVAVFENSGYAITEFYSPDFPETNVFLYMDGDESDKSVIIATDNNIVFSSFDNPSECFILNFDEGYYTLFFATIGDDGSVEITGSTSLEIEEPTTKAAVEWGDGIRRTIKEKLIDQLAQKGSALADVVDAVTFNTLPIGTIINGLTTYATITANIVLADGAGDIFKEEVAETVKMQIADFAAGQVEGAVVKMLGVKLNLSRCYMYDLVTNWMLMAAKKVLSDVDWDSIDITAKEKASANEDYIYPVFLRAKRMSNAGEWTVLPEETNPFSLSVYVEDVGEDSAVVGGKSDYKYDGYTHAYDAVLEQGFVYYNASDKTPKYVTSSYLSKVTLSLSPGTAYYVQAYIRTITGKEWYSSACPFTTRGAILEFYPYDEFGFSMDGGEETTNVRISDGGSWRILDSPKWCKVKKEDMSITVSVGESKKEREGEIVVETTSKYGEHKSASIRVSQQDAKWDNTKWSLKGWIEYDAQVAGGYSRSEAEGELEFKMISKGYSEHSEGWDAYYYINEDGQACVKESDSNPYTYDLTYVLTRTSPTTAHCVLTGHLLLYVFKEIRYEVYGEYECQLVQ